MKTNHEHFINRERGNALIYVLVAIALFAALSMTLGRQTDTSEAGSLSEEQAELFSTQLISYAVQAKSVADQMIFTGPTSAIDDMDFTLPTAAGFNTAPNINKIYHPEGGGLNPAKLPPKAIDETTTDPSAGWYIGRIDNVEWTDTASDDVLLVAYQIDKAVCEKINEKVTGSTAIPATVGGITLRDLLVDDALHAGTNQEFNTADCAGCNDYFSLCISNTGGTRWAFYSIIAAQ